ncbi:hypothetical protein C0L75_03105 [Clostridium perfringens]
MCKKYSSEWIKKNKIKNAKKRKRNKAICKIVKITTVGVIVGSLVHGYVDGVIWAKHHPKTNKFITENKLDLVGKEERIRLEKKFGEYEGLK